MSNLSNLSDENLLKYAKLFQVVVDSNSSGRAELSKTQGFDRKFAYHIVRLMLECEQALTTGTIDLERDREIYKAIRRGEWSEDHIEKFLIEMEEYLREIYQNNDTLPYKPDEDKITQLLLNCLEDYYGSLSNCIVVPDALHKMSNELLEVIKRYSGVY